MRVLIAEDHALLRDGLIRLLEAHDFEVVKAVDNGPRLVPAPASARKRSGSVNPPRARPPICRKVRRDNRSHSRYGAPRSVNMKAPQS